jgi:hypothetical protein
MKEKQKLGMAMKECCRGVDMLALHITLQYRVWLLLMLA